MSQLATTVSKLSAQGSGKLPSQTIVNPKENASVITLKSGKQLEPVVNKKKQVVIEDEIKEDIEITQPKVNSNPSILTKINPLPFPTRSAWSKKEEQEKEILDTFRRVEVNIPLLDAIKQVPRYAKFLKELCTSKRKLKGNEKISVGENVSAILQRKLPPKCKDPGIITIPCRIGNSRFERTMLDSGASISVMPLSMYKSLNIRPLKETGVVLQLAGRTNAYPKGVVEDVLVQVDGLVFLMDCYMVVMGDDTSPNPALIILGRPFLRTARAIVDYHKGTLTMEFDGEKIQFNIYEAMKYPNEYHYVFSIDVVDSLA